MQGKEEGLPGRPLKAHNARGWVTALHRYSPTPAAYRVKREHYNPFLLCDQRRKLSPNTILFSADQRLLWDGEDRAGFLRSKFKIILTGLKRWIKRAIMVLNKRERRLKKPSLCSALPPVIREYVCHRVKRENISFQGKIQNDRKLLIWKDFLSQAVPSDGLK